MDKGLLHSELERARQDFHHLVEGADASSLRRPSNGTRWHNRQLLLHILLGYLIIRALLKLAAGKDPGGDPLPVPRRARDRALGA